MSHLQCAIASRCGSAAPHPSPCISGGVARCCSHPPVTRTRRGEGAVGSPEQREAAKDERPGRPIALRSSRPRESVDRRANLGNELVQMRGPRARIRKEEPCPTGRLLTAKEV